MNAQGIALEMWVKNLFAGSFNCDETERMHRINDTFAYCGNSNNPPDAMLRGGNTGDAIEIKKLEGQGALALNSSYPKQFLLSDNPLINNNCRDVEIWDKRDMLYVVGTVNNRKLQTLCMVYGDVYCANNDCYLKLWSKIKGSIMETKDIDFTNTKELAHINAVDPLGITYFRVRSMWGIQNPWKVFHYLCTIDTTKQFNFMCIISQRKWNTFNNAIQLEMLSKTNQALAVFDNTVYDPDNPANLINVKVINYKI